MSKTESKLKAKQRGIYLLPNLFTSAGMFAGFYAIVAGTQHKFTYAGIAIFIAAIMDALDGRIARLLQTESAFGAEYDSLADMVSFGVAPALIAYSYSLHFIGKIGWLCAFYFTACGALRLARFNTQINSADKRYFQGLSIPTAAGVIVSLIWVLAVHDINGANVTFVIAPLSVIVSTLMVSKIRYHSFKQFSLKERIPFVSLILFVLMLVLIAIDPPHVLFILLIAYALSGPVLTLYQLHQKRKARKK